jgi:hypothetical protein
LVAGEHRLAKPLQHDPQIVLRIDRLRLEGNGPLETAARLVELSSVDEHEPQAMPRHRPRIVAPQHSPRRRRSLRQQAPPSIKLDEIVLDEGRRILGRRGPPEVIQGKIQIALGLGHHSQQMQRARMFRMFLEFRRDLAAERRRALDLAALRRR